MVKDDLPTHVKHIAYHAHDAPTAHSRDIGGEPLAGPHNRVVRQGIQLGHHLLRLKALLVALGHPQALLIAFDGGFHPPHRADHRSTHRSTRQRSSRLHGPRVAGSAPSPLEAPGSKSTPPRPIGRSFSGSAPRPVGQGGYTASRL